MVTFIAACTYPALSLHRAQARPLSPIPVVSLLFYDLSCIPSSCFKLRLPPPHLLELPAEQSTCAEDSYLMRGWRLILERWQGLELQEGVRKWRELLCCWGQRLLQAPLQAGPALPECTAWGWIHHLCAHHNVLCSSKRQALDRPLASVTRMSD